MQAGNVRPSIVSRSRESSAGPQGCCDATLVPHVAPHVEMKFRRSVVVRAAKELHFNKDMQALKRMQVGDSHSGGSGWGPKLGS